METSGEGGQLRPGASARTKSYGREANSSTRVRASIQNRAAPCARMRDVTSGSEIGEPEGPRGADSERGLTAAVVGRSFN
ncbi:hypothetical protein EVAR_69022_1 [Eumeta japonica]|uniref:Uncharacterized protein n=1 Tax=Eumeta variegata TaxID=151549 RepID=A0A4C2A1J9_EUMVA|nr:hypothetical protein EVAR_69022_1 [Eumeta japonica]